MLQFHVCNPGAFSKILGALGTVTRNTPTKPFYNKLFTTWMWCIAHLIFRALLTNQLLDYIYFTVFNNSDIYEDRDLKSFAYEGACLDLKLKVSLLVHMISNVMQRMIICKSITILISTKHKANVVLKEQKFQSLLTRSQMPGSSTNSCNYWPVCQW